MIYLTVNDVPSGVYKSQVIDVLKQINLDQKEPTRLISFISIRGFKQNKNKIRQWYKHSTVIPMIPGIKQWYLNKYILKLRFPFARAETCISRNVMAFAIAQSHFKSVIYDGRGAIGEELKEYPDMIPIPSIVNAIINWERKAVLEADYRIAVSNELVSYWQNQFNYTQNNHLVIPCTVNHTTNTQISKSEILDALGWSDSDTILIYSGGVAGWQSFNILVNTIPKWIEGQGLKVLFLTKLIPEIETLIEHFPNHIKQLWLEPELVSDYLSIGDYGILVREKNITNKVASPVKFAEYLQAGLNVIISEDIGDFSDFVKQHQCGLIFEEIIDQNLHFEKIDDTHRTNNKLLSEQYYSKQAFSASYQKLIAISRK